MITIFRRLRQKLIDSGNITRYLIYAVGEILLVVIGILIALQVNNWNEERKIKQEEQQVLIKLTNDLRSDKETLQAIQDFYNTHLDTLRIHKQIIFQPELSESDVRRVMNYVGALVQEINPRVTAYEEMINSGKLYNLSDEGLVDQILEYYRLIDNTIYQNRQTRNEFRALFYGPELTDFWYWRADDENGFSYAVDFFSNKDSNAYKLLKQSAGWSLSIIGSKRGVNRRILELNADLSENINKQIDELSGN